MFVGEASLSPGWSPWQWWQKSLAFGVMLLAVFMLPIAFNTWMQIAQPAVLILVEAVNRSIGLLLQATLIALVYDRGGKISVGERAYG
jgi:hypothetical protein